MIDLGPIQVISWTPTKRESTLVGFIDLEWGPFILRRLTLHRGRLGAFVIGLPQKRSFDGASGEWINCFDFVQGVDRGAFRERVLEATLSFFDAHGWSMARTEEASCA